MHAMLRRAAVPAGALSALLGLGVLPAQAAPSRHTVQAAPAAEPWECGALLSRLDGQFACAPLAAGTYAFRNNGDGGSMYVYLCPVAGGCAAAPTRFFYLTNGSSQTWDVPLGWDVLISSPYATAHWTEVQATPAA